MFELKFQHDLLRAIKKRLNSSYVSLYSLTRWGFIYFIN